MIQRVQSIYLFVAALVSGVVPFFVSLYETLEGIAIFAKDNLVFIILFLLSASLNIMAIFLYKKRQHQFVLGRLSIILNFVLLGVLIYQSQILSGGAIALKKGIGMLIPLISIVLIALANKAIKRDEDLVKSVDRLR